MNILVSLLSLIVGLVVVYIFIDYTNQVEMRKIQQENLIKARTQELERIQNRVDSIYYFLNQQDICIEE